MKIFFRALFIISAYHVMACIAGCCDEVDCKESVLNSIGIDLYDNTGQFPVLIEQDSSSVKARGFKFNLNFEGELTQQGPCASHLGQWQDWFIGKALAMKCPITGFSSPDSLDYFLIRSNKNFNAEYPVGTDLSTLFIDNDRGGVLKKQMLEWPFWGDPITIEFLLFDVPDSARFHQFIVEAHMTSGRVLSDTSKTVQLLP